MPKTRANRKPAALEGKISTFQKKCHDAGLRITPQRTAVYRALLETNEHPSAEQVFQKIRPILPNISLDTVNRTLLTLREIGAAFIVEGSGDAKRFDGNLENHQHFKCVKCKRIIDFHHKPFDDIPIPKNIGKRFTVLRKTVYFEGLCDRCLSRLGRAKTGRKKKGSG
jgi:Fe2+ or Zn2+ uptake regulation protein